MTSSVEAPIELLSHPVVGRDGYTGQVGLAGNSHVAIAQWFIAALRPPSLAAIAPWEGCGDLYREQFARGGIYAGDLFDRLIIGHMLKGRAGLESFREMYEKHPLANAWWARGFTAEVPPLRVA